MLIDKFWRAYTKDRNEAKLYTVPDRTPNWAVKKEGSAVYQKLFKFYYWDPKYKVFWLPPKVWKKNFIIPTKDITVKSVDNLFGNSTDPIFKELGKKQEIVLNNVLEKMRNGVHSTFIISQVATWKSILILWLVSALSKKTLIVVPSDAIGQGIYDKLSPYVACEFWDGAKIRRCLKKWEQLPDVLISHRQSVVNMWEQLNGEYDLLINDEQHHLSKGMLQIVNTWKGKWVVGLTGTPFRKEIIAEDFEKVYFEYSYWTDLKSLPVEVFIHRFHHTYTMEDMMRASEGLNPESVEVQRRLLNNNLTRIEELKKVIVYLYKQLWFRKIMVFIDRREYQEKLSTYFPKAILINGDSDKKEVLQMMKEKPEYLAIGITSASGEWFDAPWVEIGILFHSTGYEWTIEQAVGRAKRFAPGKSKAYWVDFQDRSIIEPDYHKDFSARQRMKYYREKWRPVKQLMSVNSLE